MRRLEALLDRDFPCPARRVGTLGGAHGGGARGRARLAASVRVAAWWWRTWLTCPWCGARGGDCRPPRCGRQHGRRWHECC